MHRAYFSMLCCSCAWLGGELEPAAPPVAFVLPAAPLTAVVATVATDGDFAPPHPASAIAAVAAMTANAPD